MKDSAGPGGGFYLGKGRKGVLLVHGFSGKPSDLLEAGRRLARRGYRVAGVRLAGHDSSLDAFEAASWQEWRASVREGYELLRRHCTSVALAGLSTGATLCLDLAAEAKVSCVVSINALLAIRDRRIRFIGILRRLMRYAGGGPDDIEDPRIRGSETKEPRLPTRAVWNLHQYLGFVKARLPRVGCPVLAMQSLKDHTVEPKTRDLLLSSLRCGDKQGAWITKGFHVATRDLGKRQVFELMEEFLGKHHPPRGKA